MTIAPQRGSDAVLDRLMALHPKLIDLTLDRMWQVLAALGDPQDRLPPVFHVAGTNGKGSTCAYLRAALEAAGYRVLVYTSPHLMHFHERIRLAGEIIPESDLLALLEECETANGGKSITFFEITTAAALLAFSRTPADALILEVGLGGRLDATNVVDRPLVSVLTPIAMDHQQFLGNTLAAIATEKAGILKPGVPAVSAAQTEDARRGLGRRADRTGTHIRFGDEDWHAREEQGRLVFQDDRGLLDLPLPRLPGAHQIANAGLAIAALRAQDTFTLTTGEFETAMTTMEWPGRLQCLTEGSVSERAGPDVQLWLDGGHNPHAARAISQAMAELEMRNPMPLHLIAGMMSTKDAGGFFECFSDLAQNAYFVPIPGEINGANPRTLAEQAGNQGIPSFVADSVGEALDRISENVRGPRRILICGSLYFAGAILRGEI